MVDAACNLSHLHLSTHAEALCPVVLCRLGEFVCCEYFGDVLISLPVDHIVCVEWRAVAVSFGKLNYRLSLGMPLLLKSPFQTWVFLDGCAS